MHHTPLTTTDRTRWAALGAAIAITLGASGVATVRAAVGTGTRTVYVPVTPCRLFDTRPAPENVGPRATPLAGDETFTVTARGTNGRCTIPTDAVALAMNVTAISASLTSYLTVWASDATRPDSSHLNPSPGAPPTPNAVTTNLSTTGQFNIYNRQGTVNVFADVVGYYADHHHDDRYYTEAETYTRAETDNVANRVVSIVQGAAVTPTLESGPLGTETFTTPISGRLMISKPFQFLDAICSPAAAIRFFLTLDGVPVSASTQVTGGGALVPAVMMGVTSGTIAAGVHTVGVGAECFGAPVALLSTPSNPGVLQVLVLN